MSNAGIRASNPSLGLAGFSVPADDEGMGRSVTHQLLESHLLGGELTAGQEIRLRIDQTLTQDATGTLVMEELEALGLERARTEVSVHGARPRT